MPVIVTDPPVVTDIAGHLADVDDVSGRVVAAMSDLGVAVEAVFAGRKHDATIRVNIDIAAEVTLVPPPWPI
jgi:hypothetical protein